jgi:hypothetical protein
MKTNRTLKLITLTAAIFGFAATSFGQAHNGLSSIASSEAAATIVNPISLTKNTDLNFGNVIPGTGIGTVVLTANNPATRSTTGYAGILASQPGTVTAAKFTVTGETGYSYGIALPETDITLTSGSNTMTVGTFTTNLATTGNTIGSDVDLYVGATLNVGVNQPTGTYEGTFSVTVTYE